MRTQAKHFQAGFWWGLGALLAICLVLFLYLTAKGETNPQKVFHPLPSKAPTQEAKVEFRAWSVAGLLHYHYERRCPELAKLDNRFVGTSLSFGKPKRQSFDGYEMEPCPYCVKR